VRLTASGTDHKGHIIADSQPHAGTTIIIRLPLYGARSSSRGDPYKEAIAARGAANSACPVTVHAAHSAGSPRVFEQRGVEQWASTAPGLHVVEATPMYRPPDYHAAHYALR
jgi:hypothetical protein